MMFEHANVCAQKDESTSSTAEKACRCLNARKLPIEEVGVVLPGRGCQLAVKTGLTAYDATAYLWLTRSTGADLVSLDRMLLKSLG